MNEGSLKDKAANGIFWGGLSTGLLQLMNIVIGIVLMKLLNPGDYGLVGVLVIFTEVAKIIGGSGGNGFVTALTNRDGFKHEDYNSVFWFSVAVCFFLYGVLFVSAPYIASFFNEPELTVLARVAFISIILSGFILAHYSLLFKNIMAKELAKIQLYGIIGGGIAAIIAALTGMGYWALIANQLVSDFIIAVTVWKYSAWRPTFGFSFTPLKEMFKFSFRLMLAEVTRVAHTNFFSVLIGKYNTVTDVGYFTQGVKWSRLGSGVTDDLIQKIAQPIFAQSTGDKEHLVQIFRKLLQFISFISFPLLFGLGFIGNELISAINAEFMPCVPVLQLYCIWGAFIPILTLYQKLSVSLGKSAFLFRSAFIFAFVQIGLSAAALPFGIYTIAAVNVASYMMYLLVWHFYVSSMINIKLRQVLFDILPFMAVSLFVFCGVWFATRGIGNIYLLIIAKVILSALLYLTVMRAANAAIFMESLAYLKSKMKSHVK